MIMSHHEFMTRGKLPESGVLYLEDAVLAVVLVGHAEQFPVLLPRPEPELDLGGEAVGLEGEGVLHVALRKGGMESSFKNSKRRTRK